MGKNIVDKISKTIDFDDLHASQHFINIVQQRWEKYQFIDFS